jgi:hypothetical protein
VSLDPRTLGWHEFWARIALIFLVFLALLCVVLFVGRLILTVYDGAMWVKRRITGEEEEEMSPVRLHRTLLRLVPTAQRSAAEKLLRHLLAANGQGCEVFVAEYDGQPATVHTTPRKAQQSCARHLDSEPGPDIPWDWFEDDYGWVMRRVDMDTGKPQSLLGGKVTRTEVSE